MFIVHVLFILFIEVYCVDNVKQSQEIFAVSGPTVIPIATTNPNLPGGVIANDAPPGPFFQDFRGPFPTDSWWSGFTLKDQNAVVAGPFPYKSATTDAGLSFGMGDVREFGGTSIKVLTQIDWTATMDYLPQKRENRKAIRWDTQTVCLQYFNGQGGMMDTCLVPGSPYITLEFENSTVMLTSTFGNIVRFEWVADGTKARVINEGGTYLIYVLKGHLELTVGTKKLTSSPGFYGTLRMVKLKEMRYEAILDAHSNTYPIGHKMSYTVSGNTISTQTWQWNVVGDPDNLLMLCWPHHRYFDWITVRTMDFSDKHTIHVAPLYADSGEKNDQLNTNWSINYLIEKGIPPQKIVLPIASIGATFRLTSAKEHGLYAAVHQKQRHSEQFYEICNKVKNSNWKVVHQSIGSYAYQDDDWTSYDDVEDAQRKAEYIVQMNLGGGSIVNINGDDFEGKCGCGKLPLLTVINQVLRNAGGPKMNNCT